MDRFINNFQNNNRDYIRITSYTLEGDPVFRELQFDGKDIQYKYDNSKHAYGGNDKGIKQDICKKITQQDEAKKFIYYYISGCSNNNRYFLLKIEK